MLGYRGEANTERVLVSSSLLMVGKGGFKLDQHPCTGKSNCSKEKCYDWERGSAMKLHLAGSGLARQVGEVLWGRKVGFKIWRLAQMPIDWWVGKQNMIQLSAECYLAFGRNEVLIHATTWMDFENIMLSKRNQAKNTPHSVCNFVYIKYQEQENV